MMKDEELAALLSKTARYLRDNSKPLDPDIQRLLYENLWDLYGDPPKPSPTQQGERRD